MKSKGKWLSEKRRNVQESIENEKNIEDEEDGGKRKVEKEEA